jgi:intracellular sulfur oxidation DsrE/DsrF family protein
VNNPAANSVRGLIAAGVKFYFCQNTTRAYLGNGTLVYPINDQVIEGVEYVTAGLGAIADFQSRGYKYVQP